MSYRQKVEQFKVSIRKRNINERMANIRAKCQLQYEKTDNPINKTQQIIQILSTKDSLILYQSVNLIKIASQNTNVMDYLKTRFELFYRMIADIDSQLKQTKLRIQEIYNDLATILINITSEDIISFMQQIEQDIASPIIKNIENNKRQISTIWLISNILYRHSNFSIHYMKMLIKWGIISYLKNRLNHPFNSQIDTTIFYYFIGAIAFNLDAIDIFNQYKQIITVMQEYTQLNIQQLYWYLLDGISQHAYTFHKFKYQIFATKILAKCDYYCKNKKNIIIHFIQGESQEIYKCSEQNKKKMISQQYERLKNNLIIKNLQFCLENRSPQVKKKIFQIAFMLVTLYKQQISFVGQYFYLTLAEEIKNIDKFDIPSTIWFLKYFNQLIGSLLFEGSISKESQYTELFLKFVENTQLFEKLNILIEMHCKQTQILLIIFDIIGFLLEFNLPLLDKILRRANIMNTLGNIEIESSEANQKRERLLGQLQRQQYL